MTHPVVPWTMPWACSIGCLRMAEDGGRTGSVIEILILRVLALKKRGDPGGTLAALERTLMLAEPEGYVRIFVDEGEPMAALLSEFLNARRKEPRRTHHRILLDYVRRLLAAFESPRPSAEPSTGPLLLAPLYRTRKGGTRADRQWPLKPGGSRPALHRGQYRQVLH